MTNAKEPETRGIEEGIRHRAGRRHAGRERRAFHVARGRRRRERDRLHPLLRRERFPGTRRRRGQGLRPDLGRASQGGPPARPQRPPGAWRRAGGDGGRRTERLRPRSRGDRLRLGDRRLPGHHGAGRSAARARPGSGLAEFLPSVLVDSASGQLAISLGLRGPNYAVVSACATGSHAVGEAAELIRRGDADAVLAGGTEACMHPLILAGFCAMRGLAAEDEHPPRASRPFDATRAGFVMGEGACVLCSRSSESAEARGANVYAEVIGYGASNDAYHMAAPDPESVGVAEMMRAALRRAGVEPERSATSTRTAPRLRSVISRRRRRSRTSSATTPTSSPCPRRSR